MPVSIKMSDDRTHLIYDFEEPLEMNELMDAYQQERKFRDETPYTLHSLVDMTQVNRIPPNWLTAKAGPGLTHPRSGQMVFAGLSHGLTVIIRTILSIARYNRMRFYTTREIAEEYMSKLTAEKAGAKESASTNM